MNKSWPRNYAGWGLFLLAVLLWLMACQDSTAEPTAEDIATPLNPAVLEGTNALKQAPTLDPALAGPGFEPLPEEASLEGTTWSLDGLIEEQPAEGMEAEFERYQKALSIQLLLLSGWA